MSTQPQAGATAASNKMMIWMMPLMSVWIGFTLPAALGVYWIAQSGFSIIQESVLGKFYNGKLEQEENERQKLLEEKRRERQDEAKHFQEEQKALSVRKQAAAKKKAQEAAKNGKGAKKNSTNENGRVGDRPYARGRAYSEQHYNEMK
jgi:Preprotein translocase subunit YidC